jgi:hypothetical protein
MCTQRCVYTQGSVITIVVNDDILLAYVHLYHARMSHLQKVSVGLVIQHAKRYMFICRLSGSIILVHILINATILLTQTVF